MILPGMFPGGAVATSALGYGSYTFNGSDEALTHDWSTSSPGTTKFTASLWVKLTSTSGVEPFFTVINEPSNSLYLYSGKLASDYLQSFQNEMPPDTWNEYGSSDKLSSAATWYHVVFRYDSSELDSDDRVRMYVDGSLITDYNTEPGLNIEHRLFKDGWQFQLGAIIGTNFFDGKLAFIDIVDGLSLAPTDFAFDDSGTWTRKPYAGSYGTYGFSLDGSDGFNDVSGNGIDFSGYNMTTGANIDSNDLPPYTT